MLAEADLVKLEGFQDRPKKFYSEMVDMVGENMYEALYSQGHTTPAMMIQALREKLREAARPKRRRKIFVGKDASAQNDS